MSGKRILLLPNTNTLSHLAQAFAIARWLEELGLECHIGLAQARQAWAAQFFRRCHLIRELWEHSGVPYPCLGWFSDSNHVEQCLCSQEELRQRLQPAMVIGIFDFLGKASARGVPFISINGHCMLPTYRSVLGFDECDSPVRRQQQHTLDYFWRFAAKKMAPSLRRRGLPPVAHANEMLVGDHNLLYEIPELAEDVPEADGYRFIGPIFWDGWDRIGTAPPAGNAPGLIVVFNSGTLPVLRSDRINRVVRRLLSDGAQVWMNTGYGGMTETGDRLFCRPFLSPREVLPRAHLVVCTGGIGACYVHIQYAVPSLVIPAQPEQATNGLQLQKHGCGRVIAPPIVFTGGQHEYPAAMDHELIVATLDKMLAEATTYRPNLHRVGHALRQYDARSAIHELIGQLS